MKNLLLLSTLLLFLFTACDKVEFKSLQLENKGLGLDDVGCVIGDCPKCTDAIFSDPNDVDDDVQVLIVEPLIENEECGCIESGLVKYLKNKKTIALVKYAAIDCNGIAYRTNCVNGDCENELASSCQLELICQD